MTQVAIKQSDDANIISLPESILAILNLQTGAKLELTIEDNKIVLNPINTKPTLEELPEKNSKEKALLALENFRKPYPHGSSVIETLTEIRQQSEESIEPKKTFSERWKGQLSINTEKLSAARENDARLDYLMRRYDL